MPDMDADAHSRSCYPLFSQVKNPRGLNNLVLIPLRVRVVRGSLPEIEAAKRARLQPEGDFAVDSLQIAAAVKKRLNPRW
jgi:hypothetical protein